ncbi:vanadium-dependent haloperoxidase [Chitinophagaceae bacterium LB-8]|uniref:Vanadium-dependent haloperoxidase n=1 Tax=Paraflavisolibacter caeni TaxID=2982496 RepID=A0A9X2XV68_9BACT|nr:vanadium-dependent haloperoxidase [Paraflavisolibacter caeni]MCU7549310.1 vanadium-dependent haloperoxidase [Paraflavisolibacter caeni]
MRYFLWVAGIVLAFISCNQKTDYEAIFKNPNLYANTVHELNRVVMGNNFSPIVASRNYLYANIAAYECIAAGYPAQYNSLSGQLNGLNNVPKPKTGEKINFEFASLLAFCSLGESVTFPKGSMSEYVDSLKGLAHQHGMSSDVFESSVKYAAQVADAIMAWSSKDHYHETRGMAEYFVDNNIEGRWVPTPPAYAIAMEPHWNEIRTLVLDSAHQFAAPPPYTFNMKDSNSAYCREVMRIKNAVDSLTEEQKHIADFWDDNPFKLNVNGHLMFGTKKFSPPGHWMSVVGIAAQQAKADYPTTVYAYAKTSIALFDAFIHCWDEKYRYNTVRPETVINRYMDKDWRPYLQTPPFPEYTCGHSTCSSAAAEALTSVFGDQFAYIDSTELEFGIKSRSFTSFRQAAEENNWARFYGGIHFHQSCIVSTEYGRKVGDYVVQHLKMKK